MTTMKRHTADINTRLHCQRTHAALHIHKYTLLLSHSTIDVLRCTDNSTTNTLEISINISYTNTMLCLAVYFARVYIYISVLLMSIFGICMYTCVIRNLSCIVMLRLY